MGDVDLDEVTKASTSPSRWRPLAMNEREEEGAERVKISLITDCYSN
jgi:hypothetical protein